MQKEAQMKMLYRIKVRRNELGYTQEVFSELIDVPYGTYTKMENGFQNITLDKIIKIADKLCVSIDYLVYGNREDNLKTLEVLDELIKSVDKKDLNNTVDFLDKIVKLKNNE